MQTCAGLQLPGAAVPRLLLGLAQSPPGSGNCTPNSSRVWVSHEVTPSALPRTRPREVFAVGTVLCVVG